MGAEAGVGSVVVRRGVQPASDVRVAARTPPRQSHFRSQRKRGMF